VVSRPTTAELVRTALDEAFAAADARGRPVAVLDAGCGRVSALKRYRPRIERFVGADIHPPAPGALPHLDEFVTADLCAADDAFPAATFDVILSSFTVEHFADPRAAFRNLASWLRPGGRLVITTVNRRHPFVWAYLAMPERIRRPIQRRIKESDADTHRLVGACNDPETIRGALLGAGFADVRVDTTGYLANAWGRRGPTRLLGGIGDALADRSPGRRSTIVAIAATADAAIDAGAIDRPRR
jgi:SAM-dependent methyltransferase